MYDGQATKGAECFIFLYPQGKVVSDYYAKIGLAGAFGEISPQDPESARRVWDNAAQAVIGDFVMWCPVRSDLLSISNSAFVCPCL